MVEGLHHEMSMKKFLSLSLIPKTVRDHHLGRNKVDPNGKVRDYSLAVVRDLRKDMAEALVTASEKGMNAKQSYLAVTKPFMDGLLLEKSEMGEIELTSEELENPTAPTYEGEAEDDQPVYEKDESTRPLPPPPSGSVPISELKKNPIDLINVIIDSTENPENAQRSRVVTEVGKIVRKHENRGRGSHVDLDSFIDDILSSSLNRYFPAIDVKVEKTFFPENPEDVVESGKDYQLKLRNALREHCKEYLITKG
ncbi:hypothetical protein ACFLQ2_00265 [archaeon]